MLLGYVFPNFEADSTIGRLKLYDFLGDSWGIIFSHPADYTPVCSTETARVVELVPEFEKRNVKLIDISCDSVGDHLGWCKDVQDLAGAEGEFPFPIVADPGRDLAVQLGMLVPVAKTTEGVPVTARAPGESCMVAPTVKDEDVPKLFPKGVTVRKVPSGKGYMRYTPQP